MLVDGLVTRGGVTGLSADPGIGKTFFALELIRCIMLREPFLGLFETRRGSVLFIGQDCSLLQYAEQVRKVFGKDVNAEISIDSGERYEDGAPIIDRVRPFDFIRFLIHEGLDLAKPSDIAYIANAARNIPNVAFEPGVPISYERAEWSGREVSDLDASWLPVYDDPNGVALIVIDTLSTLHSINENANDDMTRVFASLRILAEQTQAAILVLHHHSHTSESNPGNRWRGASSQIAMLDGWFEIKGNNRSPEKSVKVRKFRGIPPKDFKFRMETTEKECWFEFNSYLEPGQSEPSLLDNLKTFLMTLPQQECFETKQIVEFLTKKKGYSESSASAKATYLLRKLEDQQWVTRSAHGSWTLTAGH